MREYKISLNFSKIYRLIKVYKLREYSACYPIITLTASSPDDACYLVYKNLFDLLRSQKVSEEDIMKIKRKMSIKKIRCLK